MLVLVGLPMVAAIFAIITQLLGSFIVVGAALCVLASMATWVVWTRGVPLPPPAPEAWREHSPMLYPLDQNSAVKFLQKRKMMAMVWSVCAGVLIAVFFAVRDGYSSELVEQGTAAISELDTTEVALMACMTLAEIMAKMYLALIVFIDLPTSQLARIYAGNNADPQAVQDARNAELSEIAMTLGELVAAERKASMTPHGGALVQPEAGSGGLRYVTVTLPVDGGESFEWSVRAPRPLAAPHDVADFRALAHCSGRWRIAPLHSTKGEEVRRLARVRVHVRRSYYEHDPGRSLGPGRVLRHRPCSTRRSRLVPITTGRFAPVDFRHGLFALRSHPPPALSTFPGHVAGGIRPQTDVRHVTRMLSGDVQLLVITCSFGH
jgi:hypothetical protein